MLVSAKLYASVCQRSPWITCRLIQYDWHDLLYLFAPNKAIDQIQTALQLRDDLLDLEVLPTL